MQVEGVLAMPHVLDGHEDLLLRFSLLVIFRDFVFSFCLEYGSWCDIGVAAAWQNHLRHFVHYFVAGI